MAALLGMAVTSIAIKKNSIVNAFNPKEEDLRYSHPAIQKDWL